MTETKCLCKLILLSETEYAILFHRNVQRYWLQQHMASHALNTLKFLGKAEFLKCRNLLPRKKGRRRKDWYTLSPAGDTTFKYQVPDITLEYLFKNKDVFLSIILRCLDFSSKSFGQKVMLWSKSMNVLLLSTRTINCVCLSRTTGWLTK